MESFAKGDVVLFPFPFTNLTNRKLRPSLVLSDEMDEDIILCQITSKYTRKDKFSILLNKNDRPIVATNEIIIIITNCKLNIPNEPR